MARPTSILTLAFSLMIATMALTISSTAKAGGDAMDKDARLTALPAEMQGDWIGAEDDSYTVSIHGARIKVMGKTVIYDSWRLIQQDGATTVDLRVDDPAEEYDFQRRNIIGLVISPEGDFLVYNVRYSMALRRQN
ncbi:hypothetical protein [Rhizobium sp. G21]|uniref:hypothetical protein n=1 Tax=Rhizobium sp. G21 TaxID=2758439 RepID=UPI001602EA1A|nr:hypothetical protein [Rhizobium sp. G21]MBB1248438.1 hypothetical protein [Rhizobium sp. G21]